MTEEAEAQKERSRKALSNKAGNRKAAISIAAKRKMKACRIGFCVTHITTSQGPAINLVYVFLARLQIFCNFDNILTTREERKMALNEILNSAIENSRQLASSIASAWFGDDSPESRQITRRWSATDAAAMVGVSRQSIDRAEKEGRLPAPDIAENKGRVKRKIGYTIAQIDHMRDVFQKRPSRPEGADPLVISVAGHKGGSLKTTVSVHMAQWLAMKGYRVLLVDTDPQATASLYHGYVADMNTDREDTLVPFMLGERGDLEYCVRSTAWPGLDIIPSCLEMQRIESELDALAEQGKIEFEPHMMLRAGLESIFSSSDYDLIIVDGSPNLGSMTVNMVCAADIIISPTPAELNDYLSTAQFFEGLRDLTADIDLGEFEPILRVLITKYSSQTGSASQYMAAQIRETWGALVLNSVIKNTEEMGKGQVRMRTIYEQDSSQRSTLSAWNNAIRIWDDALTEIEQNLILPAWGNDQ